MQDVHSQMVVQLFHPLFTRTLRLDSIRYASTISQPAMLQKPLVLVQIQHTISSLQHLLTIIRHAVLAVLLVTLVPHALWPIAVNML